tara:strand:+ start:22 stop:651 length:630 start_codon:yes stop_codon:yes gene_type:complete
MADIVYTYFKTESDIPISAFIVDGKYIKEDHFLGLPVIEFENILNYFSPEDYSMSIIMSAKNNNKIREEKYRMAKKLGFEFQNFISPKATVLPKSHISENCFILENNVIQHYAKIGENSILWSGNHIGHHSSIGRNSFLSSHVVISGRCEIGSNCYFGVNSNIRDGAKIGNNVVVGAGANVLKDIEDNKVVMGLPGKTIGLASDQVSIL